jgi:AcrR family transcriptional regulator
VIAHRVGPFAPAVSPDRARIRVAAIELAIAHGIPALTREMLCDHASVEGSAFDRDFTDVRACCLQVYIANIAEFDRIVFGAVERETGWPERLRVSAWSALRYVRDRPLEARFNFIEMLEGGEEAQAHRDRYVRKIVELIDEGRAEARAPEAISPDLANVVFGSVYEFLQRKFAEGKDIETVDQFVPEMMSLAVRPYLGDEAANQELRIPPPPEEGGL